MGKRTFGGKWWDYFLDEIAEMDYYLQAKLLRVIQEGTIRRIGYEEIPVDVRVVSATNKSLESMVKEKSLGLISILE